jgi:hypothetical protein
LAFLRFSRDKRGYENFYLVETSTNRRGKTRARVLYWFRTPPGVKVGREPFDADVRRALEQQYPEIVFDWRKISETPIPSADAERWRERRRLEKAERARRQETPAVAGEEPAPAAGDEPDVNELDGTEAAPDEVPEFADTEDESDDERPVVSAVEAVIAAAPPSEHAVVEVPRESSRRRRRRRRRGRPRPEQAVATGQPGSNEPSTTEPPRESSDSPKPDEV